MSKYYIENRIWYLGYTWINFDTDKISTLRHERASTLTEFEARSFAFNNYADGTDMIYASFDASKLEGRFKNPHFNASKTLLEFKFLKNGCVNIILTMQASDNPNFCSHIDKLDQEGGEYFEAYNEDILDLLLPLLQSLVYAEQTKKQKKKKNKKTNTLIECNDTSLWGIPSLLSKIPLDLSKISDFAMDAKSMHGTKTLHWSVLYNQHIISNDEADYKSFIGAQSQEFTDISLGTIPTSHKESYAIQTTIGWGKKYWNGTEDELLDIKNFLEVDSVNLSKIVILATSIYFNTELSLILLKDSELCSSASVDQLRKPNALMRTHLACNEMFTQEFSEEAKVFYEKIDALEIKTMHERIRLQKESEETLLQIANSNELSNSQKKAEWFQFFLAVISAMTIFSVLQDISSFILIDNIPNPENYRLSIVLVVSLFVVWFIRDLIPFKK